MGRKKWKDEFFDFCDGIGVAQMMMRSMEKKKKKKKTVMQIWMKLASAFNCHHLSCHEAIFSVASCCAEGLTS